MMKAMALGPSPALSLRGRNPCIFPASSSSITRNRFLPMPIFCSIPPRDIPIDFGKFKGSKMGTLPSSYLRWLVREVSDTRFDVWAKYAEQVLLDPYYKDRLEWESIEKVALKADMRKGGPPAGDDASVKTKMKALGWDLSDHSGWNKVNFSLLGTTLGGRIPRMKEEEEMRDLGKKPMSVVRRKARSSSNPVLTPDYTTKCLNESKKKSLSSDSTTKEPEQSESSSLREELHRRRMLRKKIVQPRPANLLQKHHGNAQFPGRDAFLKKMEQKKLDT